MQIGDVERLVGIGQLRIVGVLDKAAFVLAVRLRIDIRCDERRVHIRHQEELARAIDHRLAFARFVHHHQRRDILLLGHPVVVGTERRRDMHDPGTVLGGHIVTGDHRNASPIGLIHGISGSYSIPGSSLPRNSPVTRYGMFFPSPL